MHNCSRTQIPQVPAAAKQISLASKKNTRIFKNGKIIQTEDALVVVLRCSAVRGTRRERWMRPFFSCQEMTKFSSRRDQRER